MKERIKANIYPQSLKRCFKWKIIAFVVCSNECWKHKQCFNLIKCKTRIVPFFNLNCAFHVLLCVCFISSYRVEYIALPFSYDFLNRWNIFFLVSLFSFVFFFSFYFALIIGNVEACIILFLTWNLTFCFPAA